MIVIVESSPKSHITQDALVFIKAHQAKIHGIFFMSEGVLCANDKAWRSLTGSLMMCSGSCHEHGITQPEPPFKIAGLALLAEWQSQNIPVLRF